MIDLIERQREGHYFLRDFGIPFPMMVRGEGNYLIDVEGNRYIDSTSGIAVVNIGHANQRVANAMFNQATTLTFTTTVLFSNPIHYELSDRIAAMTPGNLNTTFFTSGGSESAETAIKLARQYHLARGKGNKILVIGRWQGYHGNTLGALSVSGYTGRRLPYTPYLLPFPHIVPCYCYRCPFEMAYPECGVACAYDLQRVIDQYGPDNMSAFFAEPIVGAAMGATVPPPEYFQIIREICNRNDILFVCDEVMCGFGRTGKNFGIEHWGIVPDMIMTAKGMAGGYVPIGAVTVTDAIKEVFIQKKMPFNHGYTYSGNPLCCRVANEVLAIINEENLVVQVAQKGDYFFEQAKTLRKNTVVGDIRGKGLLMGIELVKDPKSKEPFDPSFNASGLLFDLCMKKGIIIYPCSGSINGIRGNHFLLCPPFTISHEEIEQIIRRLDEALQEFERIPKKEK
jgi:adenosylmethionine-8-amino-7-oxononanoate aminotransferase